MTTDNTQELDEILNKYSIVSYSNPNGIYAESSTDLQEAKQAILDWHNKQVGEVLDRLEAKKVRVSLYDTTIPRDAIEAERNKLKESKDE